MPCRSMASATRKQPGRPVELRARSARRGSEERPKNLRDRSMISIETTKRFRKCVPAARQAEVAAALRRVQEGFGQPHIHSGLGLRKLGPNLFECRTDRGWRLVFLATK